MSILFATVLSVLAIFLILLVLVQRGRGGGLTGALGGIGGSSAFGAKAGDTFTRITYVTAAIWIAVCATAVYWANNRTSRLGTGAAPLAPRSAPADNLSPGAATGSVTTESDAGGTTSATEGAAPAADGNAPAE